MTHEIRSFLTLSTAHITRETSESLSERDYNFGEYGHFIWAGGPQANISGDLWDVINYTRDLGCAYVLLDRDADTVDNLPTYEW